MENSGDRHGVRAGGNERGEPQSTGPTLSVFNMSPGSSVVPVERYIGSCLISAVGYKKDRGYRGGYSHISPHDYYPPGWALMSPANNTRRAKKDEEERSPLSKLAIHTQGAPLIQTQRQQGRKAVKSQGAKPQVQPQPEETPNENSLPRIIKPRKRRKKDRKPQQSPETAIVTLKPYTPLCQEYSAAQQQPQQSQTLPETRVQDAVQQTTETVCEEEKTTCWCRYCDPSGSVWDSPLSKHAADDWPTLQVSSEIVTSPNGHRDIEIKFFSTPPPQHNHPAQRPSPPVSVTPPWQ